LLLCRHALRRWLPLAGLGLMLTCGTNTGTGNAATPAALAGVAPVAAPR
jgi:hypothetical protein